MALRRVRVKTRRIALARSARCRKSRVVHTVDLLKLEGLTPLAKGNVRLVFAHPENPGMVVKVMRRDVVGTRRSEGGSLLSRMRRYDPYLGFVREVREFICGCALSGAPLPFLQNIRGLVETDMGLGLIADAALGDDGKLAPTAARLIAEGRYGEEAERDFEDFLSSLLACGVVISDLHERNLVYAVGRDGGKHFQMIDGLGSSTIIPFKNWIPELNRRSKVKRIARLRKRMERRLAAYRSGNPLP